MIEKSRPSKSSIGVLLFIFLALLASCAADKPRPRVVVDPVGPALYQFFERMEHD